MKKVAEIVQKLVYCCLPQSKINVSLEAEKNSSNVDSNFLPLCVAGHMPSASPLGLPTKKTNNVIITSYILSTSYYSSIGTLISPLKIMIFVGRVVLDKNLKFRYLK